MVYHDTNPAGPMSSPALAPSPSPSKATKRIRLVVAGALGSAVAMAVTTQASATPRKPHRAPHATPHTTSKPAPRTSSSPASAPASVTFSGSSPASSTAGTDAKPDESVAGVKARIAALYRQAEQLTQTYDAAEEQAAKLTIAVQKSQSQLEQGRQEYARQRASLGRMAGAEYRTGGVDKRLQLFLSVDPESFLTEEALADRMSEVQSGKIASVVESQRSLIQLQRTAADQLAALAATRLAAAQARKDVASQLREAQSLLNTLTPPQRQAVAASEEGSDGSTGEQFTIPIGASPTRAPSNRARTAIKAAYADLGKPYIYGAEGPNAFDCSGLIQKVWRQAGVELPRTSSEQAQAGQRVPVSDIQPGDLVIYYSGRNHIGLYIGGGQIIHAPHPGGQVRIAPLNSMPVNMVVRV